MSVFEDATVESDGAVNKVVSCLAAVRRCDHYVLSELFDFDGGAGHGVCVCVLLRLELELGCV